MFQFFKNNSVSVVDAKTVREVLEADSHVVILDVRTDEEYRSGHIPHSVHVPIGRVDDQIEEVIPDKNTDIYAYCYSGPRSETATEILIEKGYGRVKNFAGGFRAWQKLGYAVEK